MLVSESLPSNSVDHSLVDSRFSGWYRNDYLHQWKEDPSKPAETAVILDAKLVAPLALTGTVEVTEVSLPSAA